MRNARRTGKSKQRQMMKRVARAFLLPLIGTPVARTIVALGVAGAIALACPVGGVAQAKDHQAALKLVDGTITEVSETFIQIDGTNYPLDPTLVVTDDGGRARQVSELGRGARILYHVKHRRLDRIVIILRR